MKIKIVFLFAFIICSSAQAQFKTDIPLNSDIHSGILENGMKYYVVQNEWPKDRASFYFVQNVGAILEEDKQDGLAHFLEHMAFNGTENFPGKGIIEKLEKHGLKFGAEINAYTSLDETVYNISNVPTENQELIDSTLLMLHDWSGNLILDPVEIDEERGVIREERRTRRNAGWRLNEAVAEAVYNGSKYTHRSVIGSLKVIDEFEHQELKDYYKKWYRPDLQAVVVVGDFDPVTMEGKIKDLFFKIPKSKAANIRDYEEIPENKSLNYKLATDPEATGSQIRFSFRRAHGRLKDLDYLKDQSANYMAISMLNQRLGEVIQDSASSSLSLRAGIGEVGRLYWSYNLSVVPKEGEQLQAFEELLKEQIRAERYGFTQGELERVKSEWISYYKNQNQNKDKISNDRIAEELASYFLKAEPYLLPEEKLKMYESILNQISLNEVNEAIKSFRTPYNNVLTVTGPEKANFNYPSKSEYLQVLSAVEKSTLKPYTEDQNEKPLVAKDLDEVNIPPGNEIKGLNGAKSYTLDNGAEVIIYPTVLSNDEILFSAYSPGGLSLLDKDDLASADVAGMVLGESGLGDFDKNELRKKLSGKRAVVQPFFREYSEGFSGNSNQEDLETLLQLIYLHFEYPRFDASVFNVLKARFQDQLRDAQNNPAKAFKDTITIQTTHNKERTLVFNQDFLDKLEFEKVEKSYLDRFENAGDFHFIFVGSIPDEQIPTILQYIGNLEGNSTATENYIDHSGAPSKKSVKSNFDRQMDSPKTSVFLAIKNHSIEYSTKNRILAYMVGQLLNKRYLDEIREKEGGSYGVGVQGSLHKIPQPYFALNISFDCNPELKDKLMEIVHKELDNIKNQLPDEAYLQNIKGNIIKSREESLKSNNYWLSEIRSFVAEEDPIMPDEDYRKLLNEITPEDVQNFSQIVLENHRSVEVIMDPVESTN